MLKIAIVYFSGFGHTKKLAEALAQGVGEEARLYPIDTEGNLTDEDWSALDEADAIVYGAPTYMGGPAWQFKKFADASARRWSHLSWKDKVGAGFTNSATVNGDKFSSLQYFWTLSQQHGQIWVGLGLKAANNSAAGPDDVNWTGSYGGLMSISPSDDSPEQAPRTGDLQTAKLFGQRIADITKRLRG